MIRVEVVSLRLIEPKESGLRGFADIRLDAVTIRDFRIFQRNGKPYVKAPFTTYKNQNGELCFRQIIDLPDEVRGQVDTAILSAFYREKENCYGQQSQ
jgi:DNA-binding cell septation regulator SpoVG